MSTETPRSEWAFRLQGVHKRYAGFALQPLDLALERGQIMGYIGPNGAGKSTTLRLLLGLIAADGGEIEVLGRRMPEQAVAVRTLTAYTGDDLRLYAGATLDWHLRFVAQLAPRWDAALAQRLLQRFELSGRMRVKGLSHGQRVKAALLLALARRPELLVLDEPTTGLDPLARHEVLSALMQVIADVDCSILFSSHHTADVEQISDQIAFIDQGHLLVCADKESFLERWRRVRLAVPEGLTLTVPAAVVAQAGSTRLPVWSCEGLDEAVLAELQTRGVQVLGVEALSLEEIFLTRIAARRGGVA